MAGPADREFEVLPSGHVRDKVVLANFREGLRGLVNPETGQLFTEEEIRRATQPKSRWYNEAQALDDYAQGEQRGALWLSDQVRLERASTRWLEEFHARLWGETKLPATGSSGPMNVEGTPGTIVTGSTTLGDPNAYRARDPAGNVYQVFIGGTIPASSALEATMAAVSTGAPTNIESGTTLTWIYRDPNMKATGLTTADFTGGTDRETDAEHAARIQGIIRHRPGAGNDAHMRAWARSASNAIEDAFVYPCALHAGTTVVAITQKRGAAVGPTARLPAPGTMAAAIARLTPPNSPDVPPRAFVIAVPANGESVDLALRIALAKGSVAGWEDVRPFPSYNATLPSVTARVSDTDFTVTAPGDATLPGQAALATLSGADAPSLMLWNESRSEFDLLAVDSVEDLGSNDYRVVLTAPPSSGSGVSVGQIVSPGVARRAVIAEAIGDYFDSLGPGDLFDVEADPRGGRCVRFPSVLEEYPFRAGAVVATRVIEALGGSVADATLESISATAPTYPSNLALGPNMLILGTVGIYPS